MSESVDRQIVNLVKEDSDEDVHREHGLDTTSSVQTESLRATSSSPAPSGRRIKKRKHTSWVFDFFLKQHVDLSKSKKLKIQERYVTVLKRGDNVCGAQYGVTSSRTTLSNHLKVRHGITKGGKQNIRDVDPLQVFDPKTGSLTGPLLLDNNTKAEILEALVNWVVDAKQSFATVERPMFKRFVRNMNHLYVLPSRKTLVRSSSLAKFRKVLFEILGRVALTADGWSSRILQGYFVITIHWIDKT